ncbi:MAG: tail fiber domain-containing protein [Burkholderiales bacterium]
MRKAILLGAVAVLLAMTQPARAQFCPGVSPWVFDDVLASDPFCGFITWMADNGITLGCVTIDANHRLYCPNDNVSRKQMAAFMNRLGNVRVEAVDTGPGLTGGPITAVGTINLATTQLLPTTACTNNQIPRWNGSAWTCSTDANSGGTVTSVASGTGLTGGPITGSGTLSIATGYQLPQGCANGQVAKSNGSSAWTCANDNDAGGTVTSVATGLGLTGGPITASGTINLASTQLLPTVACANGQVPTWTVSQWTCATPGSFVGSISLPNSTAAVGNIVKPGGAFLHNFGTESTFLGVGAGNFSMTGWYNAAVGTFALQANTSGTQLAAMGAYALNGNTSGSYNTAVGTSAAASNTTASFNTALGAGALFYGTIGGSNTAVGALSMRDNVTGANNVALGRNALVSSDGSSNIAIGAGAGANLTIGSFNIDIGHPGVAGEAQTIRVGEGNQTRAFVAGIRGVTTGSNDAVAVVIDGAGQLGTINSSARYKDDIADMGDVSDVLMKLHPVTFRYKAHAGAGPVQYGLVAEEVAEVAPGLVATGRNGEAETVLYQHLPPMLLNEYQKQQRRIEAQARRIDAVEVERAALASEVAGLRADRAVQAAEIAELRRAVEVLLARTSTEGSIAAR